MSARTLATTRRRVSGVSALAFLLLLAATFGLLRTGTPAIGAAPGRQAVSHATVARTTTTTARPAKPTVVLVHGAFADASGFAASITSLIKDGYTVLAPPNPLRGLASDAASIRAFLSTITGPVVLVGHSYGGAVITQAAQGNPSVVALVYLAAYALDEGESAGEANALAGGTTHLLEHLVLRPYPGAPPGDADGYIDPVWFQQIFAADVSRREAAVMAATQRPAALSALGAELVGSPAWATIPSWYLVAGHDRAIPPEAERAMAARMGAHLVEVRSSHAVMVSHPAAVTRLIESAARATSPLHR
jgi:pimeloyl-ACP methyl ester carboxylesterase